MPLKLLVYTGFIFLLVLPWFATILNFVFFFLLSLKIILPHMCISLNNMLFSLDEMWSCKSGVIAEEDFCRVILYTQHCFCDLLILLMFHYFYWSINLLRVMQYIYESFCWTICRLLIVFIYNEFCHHEYSCMSLIHMWMNGFEDT